MPLLQQGRKAIMPHLAHNDIYTVDYFLIAVDPEARRAAPTIARSICDAFHPRRVVDIGCGTGALMMALRDLGCTCQGLEYSDAALEICRSRHLDVKKFNLESDSLASSLPDFDVTISMEVAEHLAARWADRYVDLLCRPSPWVVFTAAAPGQSGTDHVNEQPPDYWIERFAARGFTPDPALTRDFQDRWRKEAVASYYIENLILFRRENV